MNSEPTSKPIVIVDDDAQVRETLARLLRTFGYQIQSYGTASEFLTALTKCEAACLIIDIKLGSLCGIELARNPFVTALKLPVIFISGSLSEETRKKTSDLGCVAYLRKPFRAAELLAAIEKATGTGLQTP
jgi:FixJ family two-component response regulator